MKINKEDMKEKENQNFKEISEKKDVQNLQDVLAEEDNKHQSVKKKKNVFIKAVMYVLLSFVLVICCAVIFFNFSHSYYLVYGPSMTPTLNIGVTSSSESKDGVFVSRIKGYTRGDIVVLNKNYKVEGEKEKFVVKRVIAIGGDKIKIEEINGFNRVVLIADGKYSVLKEEYLPNYEVNKNLKSNFDNMVKTFSLELDINGFLTIPKDQIFLLGDNRLNSNDSSSYGTKHKDSVIGKVDYIVYNNENMYIQVIQQFFGW